MIIKACQEHIYIFYDNKADFPPKFVTNRQCKKILLYNTIVWNNNCYLRSVFLLTSVQICSEIMFYVIVFDFFLVSIT